MTPIERLEQLAKEIAAHEQTIQELKKSHALLKKELFVYSGDLVNRRIQALQNYRNGCWQPDPTCGCHMQRCPLCEDPGYVSS